MIIWSLAVLLLTIGTWSTLRRLKTPPPRMDMPFNLCPVSILKPLKGKDSNLEANLETFFQIDYPHFELIFSVADPFDPALEVAERLVKKYANVPSYVVIGQETVGINPKVNNLVRSYEISTHDFVLISDSNVRVESDYLKRMMAHMHAGVGVITAVIAGANPAGVGGHLEASYLNSFYARGLNLAFAFGMPCVVGKSMLFRKKDLARFGGIHAFGRHIAEDYKIGEAMERLGLQTVLMCDPIRQQIGRHSFRDFWKRHIRWARIRKAHAPVPFLLEPLVSPITSSLFGAIYLSNHGISNHAVMPFLILHFSYWLLNDLLIAWRLNASVNGGFPALWLFRELLCLPMWCVATLGNTVDWRGNKLRIRRKGTVELVVSEKCAGLSDAVQTLSLDYGRKRRAIKD